MVHFVRKTGFFPSYILAIKLVSLNLVSVLHRRDNIEIRKFCTELINLSVMPGRSQQKNHYLKRAAQPCSKLTDLFKKSRHDDQSSTDESLMMSQAKICKSQMSRSETTFFKKSLSAS